jgi:hypothetical protein
LIKIVTQTGDYKPRKTFYSKYIAETEGSADTIEAVSKVMPQTSGKDSWKGF